MDEMAGYLLWAHVQPSEIESMNIRRMRYWSYQAEILAKEWSKASTPSTK